METIRLEFVLEAVQPIAHHEETFGNSAVIMRRRVRQPDGTWANVPCITGDTMRHGLREAAAWAYLDAAGLLGESLTEEALRLLFAGGMITGSAGGSVRLGDYRTMVDLFPPLALLGGCAQNRAVPGRMNVDDAMLVCQEQRVYLPMWIQEWVERQNGRAWQSARAHVEEVQRVRMDPSLDPAKRRLLLPEQRALVDLRLEAREQAAVDDDDTAAQESKSSMMPRRFERVAQGALFHWSVSAICISELDRDTLFVMVGAFLSEARVGGKRGTGHGLLRAIAARDVAVRRPAEHIIEVLDVRNLGERVGTLFRQHVTERRAQIAEFLRTVAA